jgi:hypothetical protein
MSYYSQLQDTDAYDGSGDDSDEAYFTCPCGAELLLADNPQQCECLREHNSPEGNYSPELEPPTQEEIWAAYRESGDMKDLPF